MARSILLPVLIFVSAHAEHESVMACHAGWDKTGVPREHVDEGVSIHSLYFVRVFALVVANLLTLTAPCAPIVCNRAAANDPKRIDSIVRRIHSSVQSGAARQLKDQKTSYCPDEGFEAPSDDPSNPEGPSLGPPSSWIFTNGASTPVVISWVRNIKGVNSEVSAFNSDISPAHHDPRAILQPGEWRSLSVFLGHTFHIRELIDIGGGQLAPGRILVRHRAGPIPIRNKFGGSNLSCPVRAIIDSKPSEGFDRVPFDYNRRCNALFAMFANRMHCPVDVFYAGVDPTAVNSNIRSSKNTTTAATNSCSGGDRFSFHLGVNPSARPDFFDAWESPVAYEATYLTHKFVARLHHDPNIIVDEITIDKTYIQDCPNRKKMASVSSSLGGQERVLSNTGITDEEKNDEFFITDFGAALASRNNYTSPAKEVVSSEDPSTSFASSRNNCTKALHVFEYRDSMVCSVSKATPTSTTTGAAN